MSAISYAGKNTVKAVMDNIKGDMSQLTGTIVPTFQEVYENMTELESSKEDKFQMITKAEYRALSNDDKISGNYIITDENISLSSSVDEVDNMLIRVAYSPISLGTSFTAEQAEMIAAGKLSEFPNGAYWEVDGKKFRIVDNTNWYKGRGDQGNGFEKPHLIIMPDENILKADGSTTKYMKDANDTTGGYAATKYRATYRAQAKKIFTDFFGAEHIASYRGLISTAVASGRASGWSWNDCDVELPTEDMIFGTSRWGDGAGNGYGGGSFHGQMMLFRLAPEYIIAKQADGTRENYWEQNVVSAAYFASVDGRGYADDYNASTARIGVRPFTLLV